MKKLLITPKSHVTVSTAPTDAEFAMMSKSGSFVQSFIKHGDGSFNTPNREGIYFWGAHDNWQPVLHYPEKFVAENTFCTFEVTT